MKKIAAGLLKSGTGNHGAAASVSAVNEQETDVLLIGGGIMSATLGTYIQALEPGWTMTMVERLDNVAQESSNGWNNAGTGHSALMELNYTPVNKDGSVSVEKAVDINEAFQISRQFWAWQVRQGVLQHPRTFIKSVPHVSFVWGKDNVNFLRARYAALKDKVLFRGMAYSEDHEQIKAWAPLVMNGRDPAQLVAATRTEDGTDVNFGEITRQLVVSLKKNTHFSLRLNTEVRDLQRTADNRWQVTLRETQSKRTRTVIAKYVFIGAGGAALTLLQKSGIPEAKAFAGFPVGGQFLVCENPDVVSQHLAKVYGKAAVGAPPMSVPHIDTRVIDGKQVVLFGPFATFSTKFLKNGSLWDLPSSTRPSNLMPMMHVGLDNFNLVKYLIGQVVQSNKDRLAALREYYPRAQQADWRLWQAGQRVQVIKRDKQKGGVLRLGTEVVSDQQGTIAALLGASPGASTSAPIMLDVMQHLFADEMASDAWQSKLKTMLPSYGETLGENSELAARMLNYTSEVLDLAPHAAPARVSVPSPEGRLVKDDELVADIAL